MKREFGFEPLGNDPRVNLLEMSVISVKVWMSSCAYGYPLITVYAGCIYHLEDP